MRRTDKMDSKIKTKIEAMAYNEFPEDFYLDGIDGNYTARSQYTFGANPWAEWCERLGEELRVIAEQDSEVSAYLIAKSILKEYNLWLEEVDEL